MKAWEYLQNGNEIENMRAFLYRIANNLVIDDVRKKHEQSLDALQEAGYDPTGANGDDMAKVMDEKEVLETLKCISKSDRELIVMRYIDDLKPREIATILGIAPNTISVRIHRAMHELKKYLKDPS